MGDEGQREAWSGHDSGKWWVSRKPPRGAPWGRCRARWRGEDAARARTGLARVCGDVRLGGWRVSCRAPSGWGGIARSRPGRENWVSQGQRCGCRVRRRAETGEPSGQGEEPSPKGLGGRDLLAQTPIRAVQRARLWAITCTASQAPLAAKRPDGIRSDRRREVSNGVLDLGVAAVVGLQFQGLSVPVGDEAVIAVGGEEGRWEPGVGFTRRTMSRTGAAPGSVRKGV